ncbi:MAG: hypothetical protein EHM17_01780 [Verrucomicrobiaceae bacterium]|nr:MAG: hypothetical protein EHM17_01780 [Verrucomicrobiaceae bacterium]
MESEQSQNFNERLSQWVASQGFWFQVRYSMSGSGMKGRALFHLLRLGFRLLVFLLLVAIGMWVYLLKRPNSPRFNQVLQTSLQSALEAPELELRGLQHANGQLEIGRVAAQGGEGTFFESFEARNIRFKMGLLDGLVGRWQTGTVAVARMEIDLRAGTDDAQSAAKLAEAVFKTPEMVEANSFDVADVTVRWGYSERTQGSIESSSLIMQRTDTGWRFNFKGGFFRQNWLRHLEIVNLVVLAEADGLVFERAEFKKGDGTVEFPGLRLTGGERPQVNGIVKIRHLDVEGLVPPALRNFVEGSISGDFKVFGSTNSSDGIGFEGQVVMDGKDVVSLRDRFHLLKALSVVDYSRNYHRVAFREGSFYLQTVGGGMRLSEIDLKAEELLTMQGEIKVRQPTQEEVDEVVAKGAGLQSSPLFLGEEEQADTRELPGGDDDFTLRRAAQEAKRVEEGAQSLESMALFDRLGLSLEMRRLQSQASERMSRMLRYEGDVLITLPGDAFERAPRLTELFPPDAVSGRIPLRVPINGHLYELTLSQAEDIYQQGKR